MKFLLPLCFLLMNMAHAEKVKLGPFDQAHLANLMYSLPEELVEKYRERLIAPREGERVILHFAPIESGLTIRCWQDYFPPSPWASFGGCNMEVDLNAEAVNKQHDEVRIKLTDNILAAALYEVIPYGKPLKRYYSFDKFEGITF